MKMKSYISTIPFGEINSLPVELLKDNNIRYRINPFGRKITTEELATEIKDSDVLIAGTETIDKSVFDRAPKLKLIARVGIGLDGVDLLEARRRNIMVTYTPEAPAPAVAELTLGLMLNQIRGITRANQNLKHGKWERYQGRRLSELKIGVIGVGRIGGRVIRRLSALGTPRIYANDFFPNDTISPNSKIEWVSKRKILQDCDVITCHLPLTSTTKDMITSDGLELLKDNCVLINTSRGGIINESDLFDWLSLNKRASAAIDTFVDEPYLGPLASLENCTLTCHMGSMTEDCRSKMEIEATREVVNFQLNKDLIQLVPEAEYEMRKL